MESNPKRPYSYRDYGVPSVKNRWLIHGPSFNEFGMGVVSEGYAREITDTLNDLWEDKTREIDALHAALLSAARERETLRGLLKEARAYIPDFREGSRNAHDLAARIDASLKAGAGGGA